MKRILKSACLAMMMSMTACSAGVKGGMPDYCYVTGTSTSDIPKQYFHLYGHRKWDNDIRIGIFETLEEARAAAVKVDCPFRY